MELLGLNHAVYRRGLRAILHIHTIVLYDFSSPQSRPSVLSLETVWEHMLMFMCWNAKKKVIWKKLPCLLLNISSFFPTFSYWKPFEIGLDWIKLVVFIFLFSSLILSCLEDKPLIDLFTIKGILCGQRTPIRTLLYTSTYTLHLQDLLAHGDPCHEALSTQFLCQWGTLQLLSQ